MKVHLGFYPGLGFWGSRSNLFHTDTRALSNPHCISESPNWVAVEKTATLAQPGLGP